MTFSTFYFLLPAPRSGWQTQCFATTSTSPTLFFFEAFSSARQVAVPSQPSGVQRRKSFSVFSTKNVLPFFRTFSRFLGRWQRRRWLADVDNGLRVSRRKWFSPGLGQNDFQLFSTRRCLDVFSLRSGFQRRSAKALGLRRMVRAVHLTDSKAQVPQHL